MPIKTGDHCKSLNKKGGKMCPISLKSYRNRLSIFLVTLFLCAVVITVVTFHLNSRKKGLKAQVRGYVDKGAADIDKTEKTDPSLSRPVHTHAAFFQRLTERKNMVERQIHRRGIDDTSVLKALETVPRHVFVRRGDQRQAYNDHPLPIGYSQTISQPYIVGYMTEFLKLKPDFKVLEVGTGSGYQAAVCAEIAREVYTIEIVEPLAKSAKSRLKELGYPNVFVKAGDGYFGWAQKAPFDVIIITAAAGLVPPPLLEQLKAGGRMILPLGSPYGLQTLVLIEKDDEGNITSRQLLPVRFVPMVGRVSKVKPGGPVNK